MSGVDQKSSSSRSRLVPYIALGLILVGFFLALLTLLPRRATVEPAPLPAHAAAPELNFVLATMWSPAEGYEQAQALINCLEEELGEHIGLVQRRSYSEGNAVLTSGGGDFGLICAGATRDAKLRDQFDAPLSLVSEEGSVYHSVLIVRPDDPAQSLAALSGSSVAWVDPISLTGYRALRARLRAGGHEPDAFFGTSMFTHSHDHSIQIVVDGVARAAPVDEEILKTDPRREQVRVLWRSPAFPSPTFVVRKGNPELTAALRKAGERPECIGPLGAQGLEEGSWERYIELQTTIENGR